MKNTISIQLLKAPRLVEYYFSGYTKRLLTTKSKTGRGKSYHLPQNLDENTLKEYKEKSDWLIRYQQTFQKNKKVRRVAGDLRIFSELVDLKIEISKDDLISVAYKLSSIGGPYFENLANSLFSASMHKKEDISELINKSLKQTIPTEREAVRVVSHKPLNEFDLISKEFYRFLESSFEKLSEGIDDLSFKHKYSLLEKLLKSNISVDLNATVEVIARPIDINKLINSRIAYKTYKQPISPYFGYDINDKSLDNQTVEMIEKCFDYSYQLYSLLQNTKNPNIAQLVVLNGYRQRALVDINYKGFIYLLNNPDSNQIRTQIREKLRHHYPLITELTSGV